MAPSQSGLDEKGNVKHKIQGRIVQPFEFESNVRSYCRDFPAVFSTAANALLKSANGDTYIDFLSGAGSLNYGHNNPDIKNALLSYLGSDGITQSLDLHTEAKASFIERFVSLILSPRGLDYKLQFTGPTGTNAVEASLKLARLVKGRAGIATFTNAFHGMTLGALSASGNRTKREGAGLPLANVTVFPFDGYCGADFDTVAYIERLLTDAGSGIALPAAFIVETVQAEGGLNIASADWLRRLSDLARRLDVLLIVDDIQAGCGRTGAFFSFETADIRPDIVCLSKSLGGYGLPMSMVLLSPELDVWKPGQHNGTFRGNNLAFVAASAALGFWADHDFTTVIQDRSRTLERWLASVVDAYGSKTVRARQRGLIAGLEFDDPTLAKSVSTAAFKRGVIVETCGARDQVLKFLPPLTIETDVLTEGLGRIRGVIDSRLG